MLPSTVGDPAKTDATSICKLPSTLSLPLKPTYLSPRYDEGVDVFSTNTNLISESILLICVFHSTNA